MTDVSVTPAATALSHIFQVPGWGELKTRMGWRTHSLAVPSEGSPRASLLILEKDFPKIGRRFFYAPRGPVLHPGWTGADLDALFVQAEVLARVRRVVFLKIDPAASLDNDFLTTHLTRNRFQPAPVSGGFSGVQPRCVFRLNISPDEETLLKGMDQKTRYNIRLATKKGVVIRPISTREEISVFYRLLVETATRDRFLIRPEKYFQDIQECLGAAGHAQYFLAEAEGRPIAGALALVNGSLAWYSYGASANTSRDWMPNHLMQWTLIRWAKTQGAQVYDFRAVPSDPKPEDPLYGLYRFKKGFGGTFTEFIGEFDRVYSPLWYGLWVKGWPLFKALRRKFLLKSRRTAPEGEA